MDSAVVSVTQIHGGDAWNVIPNSVVIRGTARCFDTRVQDQIQSAVHRICSGIGDASGTVVTVDYARRYPPTVNSNAETDKAIAAARAAAGPSSVHLSCTPSTASEDFAFMLRERPGAYIWMGADGATPSAALHNPSYDFNDETLSLGAAYWVALAQELTPA